MKTTTKKILVKPESRSSRVVQYYKGGAEIQAELRSLGVRDKNETKKRTRVKRELYDPVMPTKTVIKPVVAKEEVKHEPFGHDIPQNTIKSEADVSQNIKSEPMSLPGGSPHNNQPGMNLPCFPAEMVFNPMTQVPYTGVRG